jgi:integrase
LARPKGFEPLTPRSVGALIAVYLREHAERKQRPRTLLETRRALERHWAPLHALPAAAVDRRDVSTRLLDLARASGPVGANRARANLSACFAWGMRAGRVDANPVIGAVKGEEASRDRVLSPAELRAIWRATAALDSHDIVVRLLILLGARRAEVGGMAWAELDRGQALWTLPGARTKNGLPHELPLSRRALELLAELPELRGRPYVFGRRGRAPFSGWSACKARLDARIAAAEGAPLPAWHLHDLRRSAVTHMAEHGLAEPHVIEAIVNHSSGHRAGVAGVYNKALYRQQKRVALQRWDDWLETATKERAQASRVVALAG